jgi:sigma-B regulation protein RsbU (phosphoserine phosphatase)
MSETVKITVFEDHREVHSEEYSAPVELGRQDREDDEIYRERWKEGRVRIAVARKSEVAVSKKQILIEPLPEGWVRLTNQSSSVPIRVQEDGADLAPESARELRLPVTLLIDQREVRIEPVRLATLAEAPLPPGARANEPSLLTTFAADRTLETESLLPWLQATVDLLHSAASDSDCFDRAAGALVEMVGLDAGRVLLLEGADWRVKALRTTSASPVLGAAGRPWNPSKRVLARLRAEKRTFWWEAPPSRMGSLLGVAAVVAAPILDRQGEVIGALYGDRDERSQAGRAFAGPITRLQAMLAQLLASGVAASLAQKKLVQMERDLEIGRQIQAGFLPAELPRAPGWELTAHFRPAREVSGDFYDAFALPGGLLALAIADVCDKGVGAALYMTLLRSLLRAFAEQAVAADRAGGLPPAESIAALSVERLNSYVARTHGQSCMFASLFFGILDPATGVLAYINAGHEPPVLIRCGGTRERLAPTGLVVGVDAEVQYAVTTVQFEPGDILLAYTDGVTEARDPSGGFFTERRLLAILEEASPSATALVGKILAGLNDHIAGAEPHDDVTILSARREP